MEPNRKKFSKIKTERCLVIAPATAAPTKIKINRNKLNEDFFNEYTKMAQIFYNKAMSSPEEKEGFLEKQTKALNLALKLRDSSYKKKIIENQELKP